MSEKNRYTGAVIVHAALLIMEGIAFFPAPVIAELVYYTQLSNLLEMIVSALFVIDAAVRLKKGIARPSVWVRIVSYTAACMLTITLLVVVFVLSPMKGTGGLKHLMLDGELLYKHFLCPVLALAGFLLFEKTPPLTKKHLLPAMLPTFLYAAVTTVLNALRVMHGPYPFLYVHEQPLYLSAVWAAAILGGAFLIAWGLKKLSARGSAA